MKYFLLVAFVRSLHFVSALPTQSTISVKYRTIGLVRVSISAHRIRRIRTLVVSLSISHALPNPEDSYILVSSRAGICDSSGVGTGTSLICFLPTYNSSGIADYKCVITNPEDSNIGSTIVKKKYHPESGGFTDCGTWTASPPCATPLESESG
ncbi:MAG: hypothetical protein FMNOHCHN_03308 [Ignavibacteriaceae bacterium]|nr:hypothetical protein [Ignavibacteriaceae bacterium]